MTEKDLWGYKVSMKRLRLALEKLKMQEAIAYAPPTQIINGMPAEHISNGDKMALVLIHLEELRERVTEAKKEATEAAMLLCRVENILNGEEAEFLHLRYRKMLSWSMIEKEMHYSDRHLARIRRSILEKISEKN